jgi:hypothetical protein
MFESEGAGSGALSAFITQRFPLPIELNRTTVKNSFVTGIYISGYIGHIRRTAA